MTKLKLMQQIQVMLFERGYESEISVMPEPCLKLYNKSSLPMLVTHNNTSVDDLQNIMKDIYEGTL